VNCSRSWTAWKASRRSRARCPSATQPFCPADPKTAVPVATTDYSAPRVFHTSRESSARRRFSNTLTQGIARPKGEQRKLRHKFGSLRLAPALALLACTPSLAQQSPSAYVINSIGAFGTLDLTTGAFQLISNTGTAISGMGQINGQLYAGGWRTNVLYVINPATGALTPVGAGSISGYEDFGSTTAGLFGIDTALNVYSVNPSTGATTLLGNAGLNPSGLASAGLSTGSSTLYLSLSWGFGSPPLYTVDTTTGLATLVGPMSSGVGAFVFQNGILYGVTCPPSIAGLLLNVNPTTGGSTVITGVDPAVGIIAGLAPMSALLTFPLKANAPGVDFHYNSSTAPVNSVFDHSMKNASGNYGTYQQGCDDMVIAFTGVTAALNPSPVYGCEQAYEVDGNPIALGPTMYYRGANNNSTYLNYDDHPGIDYQAQLKTQVYAAVSGTVHYPGEIVGIRSTATAAQAYHVLEIIPDYQTGTLPPYVVYYLHLDTYPCPTASPKVPCQTVGSVSTADPDPLLACSTSAGYTGSTVALPLPDGAHVTAGCMVALSGNAPATEFKAHLHFSLRSTADTASLRGFKTTRGTKICWLCRPKHNGNRGRGIRLPSGRPVWLDWGRRPVPRADYHGRSILLPDRNRERSTVEVSHVAVSVPASPCPPACRRRSALVRVPRVAPAYDDGPTRIGYGMIARTTSC
jgi:hypothetical protein